MKKQIFGKTFEILFPPTHESLVSETFALYTDAVASPVDVSVEIGAKQVSDGVYFNNPKIHFSYRDSMETKFPQASVRWCPCVNEGPVLRAFVDIDECYKGGFLRKILSLEFPTCIEWFQQVVHELVLIPAVYFLQDRALLHAACVSLDDKVVAFTGTGGVGKSSAMLALRNDSSASFLSDDILIVDSGGKAYGNMAWPKIYGYNLADPLLKAKIFSRRGILDRFLFDVRCRIDPARVRRKVKPNGLYEAVAPDGMQMTHIVNLVRGTGRDFEVRELVPKTLARMSELVLFPEYAVFHQHLYWEEYNALAGGAAPALTMGEVIERWREVWSECFGSVSLRTVMVPVSMDQDTLMNRLEDLVEKF